MALASAHRSVEHLLLVVLKSAEFRIIIAASDGQDREVDLPILFSRGVVGIPVFIDLRVCQPFLEHRRWIAKHRVEIAKWAAGFVPLTKDRRPEVRIGKYLR